MSKTKKNEVEAKTEEVVEETQDHSKSKSKKSKKDKKDKKDKKSKKDKKDKKDKKEKKSKKTKKTEEPEPEPVAESESVAEPEPVAEVKETTETKEATETTEQTPEDVLATLQQETDATFKEVLGTVKDYSDEIKKVMTMVRNLQRQVTRERRETGKLVKKLSKSQKKKRRAGNKSPGGFTKPVPLSSPLCEFLGVDAGTELARTDVTKRINAYVKEHELQNPENKKIILPDAKLRSLLYLSDDDELTYFNLQGFMKPHYLKRDKETGEVAEFVAPATN